jgi:hypothetical protein
MFFFFFLPMCRISLGGVGQMKISYVGFLRKDDCLRAKLFTKLSFPMLVPLSLGRSFGSLRLC